MRQCTQCHQAKADDAFYCYGEKTYQPCRMCHAAKVRSHRAKSPRPREYDRERAQTAARKKRNREVVINWRKNNPEKYKAQTRLNNALRDGRIAKEPCLLCGSTHVHAHHEDYSQPLMVIWLCPRHHHLGHSIVKRDVATADIEPGIFDAGTTVPPKQRIKRMETAQ